MKVFVASICVAVAIGFAAPASAQEFIGGQLGSVAVPLEPPPTAAAPAEFLSSKKRPAALLPLYTGYAVLQLADAGTTIKALGMGGSEANSLMKGVAARPIALVSLKVALSAATIYGAERMWRKGKRKTAMAMMIGVNVIMGVVVNHNRRVINQLSR